MSHRATSSLEAPRLSRDDATTLLAAEPALRPGGIQWCGAVEWHAAKLRREGYDVREAIALAIEAETTARLARADEEEEDGDRWDMQD